MSKALITKSAIITLNFFCFEYLFHIIRIESEVNIKIIVQAITINELEGVHAGRLIVLYQTFPESAK